MIIFCVACGRDIVARLTSGEEIYPHRPDLFGLPFWKCDTCENFVGCHHKTKSRTNPLGCIPTPELRRARSEIHKKLDPLWKSGKASRREVYRKLGEIIGREYHTAEVKSLAEVSSILAALEGMAGNLRGINHGQQ